MKIMQDTKNIELNIRKLPTANFFNGEINYEYVECFGTSDNLLEMDKTIILPFLNNV